MPSLYELVKLQFPVIRDGLVFTMAIKRRFPTEFEGAGANVFYFSDREEADQTLEKLNAF